jgi:hypothetical protein
MATRRPIVALTSARIVYAEAGAEVERASETLLLNSARIETLEATTIEDIDGVELGDAGGEPAAILDRPRLESEGLGA